MAGTLNAQLKPSALRPGLAKAALEALMQQISNAAAAISMINLMARSSVKSLCRGLTGVYITKLPYAAGGESARYLHKNHAGLHRWNPGRVSMTVQGAYHSL